MALPPARMASNWPPLRARAPGGSAPTLGAPGATTAAAEPGRASPCQVRRPASQWTAGWNLATQVHAFCSAKGSRVGTDAFKHAQHAQQPSFLTMFHGPASPGMAMCCFHPSIAAHAIAGLAMQPTGRCGLLPLATTLFTLPPATGPVRQRFLSACVADSGPASRAQHQVGGPGSPCGDRQVAVLFLDVQHSGRHPTGESPGRPSSRACCRRPAFGS